MYEQLQQELQKKMKLHKYKHSFQLQVQHKILVSLQASNLIQRSRNKLHCHTVGLSKKCFEQVPLKSKEMTKSMHSRLD